MQSQASSSVPNTRFSSYTQIVKNDMAVGFKLDNNDFQFLFDKHGGWYDQEGKYYNAQAISCDPPQGQESQESESEGEEQGKKEGAKEEGKLAESLMKMKISEKTNDRVEALRQLTQIIESYPQGQPIRIVITLQPTQPDQDTVIQQCLSKRLSKPDLQVFQGVLQNILDQQMATNIIQLQGTKLDELPSKPTIYVDVELYNSLEISFAMSKKDLEKKFAQLQFVKYVDFANMEQKAGAEHGIRTHVEICRDIEEELWEEGLEFKVENQ